MKPNPVVNAGPTCPSTSAAGSRRATRLTVDGVEDACAAGDVAAVPDLTNPGQYCAPNAQHAVRQAKVLADNITRSLRGKEPVDYRHKYVGSVAGLGLHKGVAHVYGDQAARASPPGSCTAPTTCRGCPPSTARPA